MGRERGESGDSRRNGEREKGIMVKGERDTKPVLLNLGLAVALSLVGFLFTQIQSRAQARARSVVPSPIGEETEEIEQTDEANEEEIAINGEVSTKITSSVTTTSKSLVEQESLLLPEFNDLVIEEFGSTDPTSPVQRNEQDSKAMEQEISFLKNLVCSFQEREKTLELQLLEFYGLQEQEAAMRELQNQLKVISVETKLYTLKIESLESENAKLRAQLSDYSRMTAELEELREKVRVLKGRVQLEEEQTREKLRRLEVLEEECINLKRKNESLEQDKLELVRKSELGHSTAACFHTSREAEALEEASILKQEHEKLRDEIEQLKLDRCADLEELVYLQWINACLRYELRNHNPTNPGQTLARDLSKTLSPRSEEKAKQLILEYAYTSGPDESPEQDYCSFSRASSSGSENSLFSSINSNSSKKLELLSKLRKLVLGKGIQIGANNNSCDEIIGRNSQDSVCSCLSEEMMTVQSADQICLVEEKMIGRSRSDIGDLMRSKGVVAREGSLIGYFGENKINENLRGGNEKSEKNRLKRFASALRTGRWETSKSNRRTASSSN